MPGINLIGYATSPTGLGEDLRAFAMMLDHLEIPYSVIDVPTESQGKVQHNWRYLSKDIFRTSFFFMSPMECARLAEAQPQLFAAPSMRVGYFLWELPDFPEEYVDSLKLVDHIWCPTHFVQRAFFQKSKQLILSIPLPVINVPPSGRHIREELGIPQDAFVALYMFDVRSTLARKNPQATIETFLRFAVDHPDAYLILKANRIQTLGPKARTWIPQHPRIRLVTETMQAGHLADLYQASDAYLSLHRSEGFGRTLVEAMQHGLQLISTRYSGPADFLTEKNAHLVSWTPCNVSPGEYPFTTGSSWAEPDIDSAVEQLTQARIASKRGRSLEAKRSGMKFTVESLAEKYRPILQTYIQQ